MGGHKLVNMKTQHAIFLSLFALLGLSSCEEDDLSALLDPQNSEIASRYVSAEGEFLNIYSRFESALRDSVLAATGQTTQDGATISWDASSMVLAIDFGATNVLSAEDGKSRRGKIEVTNVSPAFLTTSEHHGLPADRWVPRGRCSDRSVFHGDQSRIERNVRAF